MIDFRYHLVSIVAIFLALAVGIVMGTTLLQEPAIELAKKTSDDLTKANYGLRTDLDTLRGREAANDAFITSLTPEVVGGALTGQRVLLVDTPGSSAANREAEQQILAQAGAAYAGRVTLSETFLDSQRSGVIENLTTQLKPGAMTFAPAASVYDKAAALLGAALLTTDPAQAGTPNNATAGVLDGFERANLLTVDGDPTKRATVAVMFAPEKPFDGEHAEIQSAALVSLAGGLDAAGKGVVVAGTASTAAVAGGLISAVRDDSEAAKRVSTVDTADMPAGRVVVVYALREQLSGRAGQYGVGTGASAPQPAAPTPTASPTQSGS
ncbi:copper transporter [Nonomuraea sp. NPDC000554]|uniref:copper transporter n=1 Tax=Nonomuraea sp. NPDC000554 TaxID=3154259 RepID=UPI00332ACA43